METARHNKPKGKRRKRRNVNSMFTDKVKFIVHTQTHNYCKWNTTMIYSKFMHIFHFLSQMIVSIWCTVSAESGGFMTNYQCRLRQTTNPGGPTDYQCWFRSSSHDCWGICANLILWCLRARFEQSLRLPIFWHPLLRQLRRSSPYCGDMIHSSPSQLQSALWRNIALPIYINISIL